jgi:hypothetical protein
MGAHSIGSQEGAVVAAETQSLYERLGGAYTIAVVVDEFIDRIMVDPRLNANPRVDEAHHRVSAQGFNYHVTEQVCLGGGRPADLLGAHDARRAPRSAHLRRGVGCVHGRLPPDPREVRRATASETATSAASPPSRPTTNESRAGQFSIASASQPLSSAGEQQIATVLNS